MVATVSSITKRSNIGKNGRDTISPPAASPFNGDEVYEIDAQGDVVLCIDHARVSQKFRIDSAILRSRSKYFNSLLSGPFGEGEKIVRCHESLREEYTDVKNAPSDKLPTISIEDVGQISTVKSIAPLCIDFLTILHGKDLPASPPVVNVANLAIVADRFDALDYVKRYVRQKKILHGIDGKTTPKAEAALTEEKVRQRLLIGVLLDYTYWMEKYSARMIGKGWVGGESNASAALWWDLPFRIEDELAYRRECVLETIQSLQSHFIGLYASRDRQCKLGYDSSPQCDSFQLGEIIRFFTRIGTIQIRGTLFESGEDPPSVYEGDLSLLLDSLRQVSEYQIDRNHNHCGIRTRIIPILDTLAVCLSHIGLCGECWSQSRFEHSWLDAKRPLLWRKEEFRLRDQSHKEWHAVVRAVFTATDRDWS